MSIKNRLREFTIFRLHLINEELEDLNESPDLEITQNLYRNALVHQIDYMNHVLESLSIMKE